MVTIERRHGVVSALRSGEVVVRIQQQSACSGCHAKEFCCSVDCADRDITVKTDDTRFGIGDAVIIEGRDSIGRLAVFLSFVLPILLLVVSLVLGITVLEFGEVMSILCAFGVLALYYAVLRLFDAQLGRIMHFEIIKAE